MNAYVIQRYVAVMRAAIAASGTDRVRQHVPEKDLLDFDAAMEPDYEKRKIIHYGARAARHQRRHEQWDEDVLRALANGYSTNEAISHQLDLSRMTVARCLERLCESGRVINKGRQPSQPGRLLKRSHIFALVGEAPPKTERRKVSVDPLMAALYGGKMENAE